MTETLRQKRRVTAREGAKITGYTPRHVRRLVAVTRADWIEEKAAEREEMRAYHDDEGHSWTEAARHFGVHVDTVKQRAYRARKERAREAEEAARGPMLPGFEHE